MRLPFVERDLTMPDREDEAVFGEDFVGDGHGGVTARSPLAV